MQSSLFTTRLCAGWTRWSTQWSAILVTKPILRAGLWGRLLRKWCFPPILPTTPISSSTTALLSGQSRQSIMAILAGSGELIFFWVTTFEKKSQNLVVGRQICILWQEMRRLSGEKCFFGWRMFFWGRMFCPNSSRCGSLPDGLSWEAEKSRCWRRLLWQSTRWRAFEFCRETTLSSIRPLSKL